MENTFSSRIKELRRSLKMTQSEFALSINSSQNALSGYENGDRVPSYDVLLSIASKYNISIDWLCGLSNRIHTNYQSYGDIFNELVKICTIKYPKDSDMKHSHILHINFSKEDSFGITFNASDSNFSQFFNAWVKIYKNYSEGLIDEDLYNIWLERELAKYDFQITGLPGWISE